MKGTTSSIMQPDGTLRCRCGGTQFKPQRSTGRKVALGVASLLGSTNEVRCLACGTKYRVRVGLPPQAPPTPPRPDPVPVDVTARAYEIWLTGYTGSTIPVIKGLRKSLIGLGLREGKAIVDSVPAVCFWTQDGPRASAMLAQLERYCPQGRFELR